MKILGHRHTGTIVDDFEKMLEFYIGLGLTLRRRDIEKGPFIDELLGTENIVLETAKLILENEELPIQHKFSLELMKIINDDVDQCANISKESGQFSFLDQTIGVLDIAFTVDDIGTVIEYVIDQGGELIGKPLESPSGFRAYHCYVRDPEGNVLHLAQNLD